jgi:hypothetical protein
VDADIDFDSGACQHAETCAAHALVWIGHRRDDTSYAGVDHDLRTRRGAMFVRAGLEVDVQRSVARAVTGSCERFLFRVWLPRFAVESFARNMTLSVQDDCAHHRIRASPVVGLARQLNGARRPVKVYVSVAFRRKQSSKYIREPKQTA